MTPIPETLEAIDEERMLAFFSFDHLPPHLKQVSQPFHQLAEFVANSIDASPERSIALRKLLEAKDAAVRARLHPGI